MKVIKNITSGLYLVKDKGFIARVPQEATAFTDSEAVSVQECVKSVTGASTVAETFTAPTDPNIKQNADGKSFAVSYVRAKQLRGDGSINTHKLNPSKRRFATYDEATHHGRRFMAIEKHLGFYVTETFDRVNAYVNKVTGKTNPEIGKARTNR